MTLEEYKEKVREFLLKRLDEDEVEEKMTDRADGIEDCYNDGIEPESTGAGLIRNFV